MTNSSAELDKLKKEIPLWAVASERLKGMSKRGAEYDFLCPYHEDTTQSFQVYQEDDGTWLGHCQACGETANVFQLIQKTDGVTFPKAVKIVQAMMTNPEWEQMRADAETVFQSALKNKQEAITVPLAVFDKYIKDLQAPSNRIGQEWLQNRGISNATADQFSLGYVQQPLPQIVPTNHPWSNKGWIMFPEIRNGRIMAVKYRSVMGKRIPKTDTEQGWSGFAQRKDMLKSPLYNQDAINSFEDVLITEGECDTLVLAQAGFCAVSLPSAGYNPNDEQRGLFMKAHARYLAGDMDEAGTNAMSKLHKELGGDNPHAKTYWLQWPKPCKDANQFFLEYCGGNTVTFHDEVIRLMDEAKDRRLPGIRDLKTITRNAEFKPTHENPNRLKFPWFDHWVDILPGEVMYMFATETKMGKSTWLMNILIHNVRNGKKIVNYGAELSPERYAAMVTAHLVRANRNTLTKADFVRASELIPDDSFYLGYKPGAKWKEVMKLLAEAKQVYGGDIFVVDPLHFILRGGTPGQENSEFASAMSDLVNFAIKWNVIVIAVGQGRKALQGSRGRMAQGQDSRGTSTLAEDASTTWILHRNRVAQHRNNEDEEGEPVFEPLTRVKLDYSRNSDAMSGKLVFDGATATFNSFSTQTAPEEVYDEETATR